MSVVIIIIRVVPPLTPSLLNAETLHTYPLTPTLLKNFLYTIYVIYIYNTFYYNKGVLGVLLYVSTKDYGLKLLHYG